MATAGREVAGSVVLGTLRGVTGMPTDSVIGVEPDMTTTGLMAVARPLLGRQYSGIVVTVTVTVPSRATIRSESLCQHSFHTSAKCYDLPCSSEDV